MIACGVNPAGSREILAVESRFDESEDSWRRFFPKLKARSMKRTALCVSDVHAGLQAAVREEWLGASCQLCKVHFMRNILAKDSLSFHDFSEVDKKRISSTNGQEPLNMEIRRWSRVVGVFPSVASYLRLTICYLIEHSEDWENERSYIREDIILGSLDRLHDLMAQAAN